MLKNLGKICGIDTVDFGFKLEQDSAKNFVRALFSDKVSNIENLIDVFDNSKIIKRNFCVPFEFFGKDRSFKEKNSLFQQISLKYSAESIHRLLSVAGIESFNITDFIYINTTGLYTPSLDAILIDNLKLNPNINRYPIWGLGCAGGVSAVAKANQITKANPDAVVLILCVELCSLTFRRNDFSKSNFIATTLFSDGICSMIVTGEEAYKKIPGKKFSISVTDSLSKLYYDSLDVMGWDFLDDGFKVLFSKDIPSIISQKVKPDVLDFLLRNNIAPSELKNFIAHPGGMKIINAYKEAFSFDDDMLQNTFDVLQNYGNMSSVTVLYVLDSFIKNGFKDGSGLMISLGPGFSCEQVLLEMKNL